MVKDYYKMIQGWCDPFVEKLYSKIVQRAKPHDILVEVGVWKGKSACMMAQHIEASGKPLHFFAVDTFEGSPEHQTAVAHEGGSTYHVFSSHMEKSGAERYVRPVRMDSVRAAKCFGDESVDFVFIDADHSYEGVRADLFAWFPKIKRDGIIAGHDFDWKTVKSSVRDFFKKKVVSIEEDDLVSSEPDATCWAIIK